MATRGGNPGDSPFRFFAGSIRDGAMGFLGGLVGGVLGGFGLFKAGSGVSRAAKSLAANTGQTLAAIRNDVGEIKEHLLREVWPRVNETLSDVQALVRETQTFVITGTFTVKILALLLLVCILYVLKKQLTALQWRRSTYWQSPAYKRTGGGGGGSPGAAVLLMESAFLQFLFWICLLMAVVLGLHLVQEIFLIANVGNLWPANIPFIIIIIPSVATIAVVLQHITDIIRGIAGTIMLLVYTVIALPLSLSVGPVISSSQYARTSHLLLSVTLLTIPFLYCAIAVFPALYLWEMLHLQQPLSLLEFALLVYLVFFATAIGVHILGEVVLRVLIRPLWDCWARKTHCD